MTRPLAGEVEVVPGPRDLALLHERAMPQKDQLCGPFWGALILSAAGSAASQEEVAFRAGTTLAEGDPAGWLPPGASPRTDYAVTIPVAPEEASSGTSAKGVARSIEGLSGGTLAVVPVAGPWGALRRRSLSSSSAPYRRRSARSSPTYARVACGGRGRGRGSCSTTCSGDRWRRHHRIGTAGTS